MEEISRDGIKCRRVEDDLSTRLTCTPAPAGTCCDNVRSKLTSEILTMEKYLLSVCVLNDKKEQQGNIDWAKLTETLSKDFSKQGALVTREDKLDFVPTKDWFKFSGAPNPNSPKVK